MDSFDNPLELGANRVRERSLPDFPAERLAHADYAITAGAVLVIVLAFVFWNQTTLHWFLIPVAVCGLLAGVDVVRWLTGELDLFDPKTIIGCLAFYGFFVAPLLNVAWDTYGVGDFTLWGDWRPWLGAMAALNALGLVAYRAVHNWVFRRTKLPRTCWEISPARFYPLFAIALIASIIGTVTLLWQLNGISGMVLSYESDPEAFVGKGWLLIFAWPLAVLSFIAVVYSIANRRNPGFRRVMVAILVLSAAGLTHFVFVGWFGSRGTTVWALFWMAGIVHYRLRRLSRNAMGFGVIFVILFMYFYGFYKEQKRAALEVLRTPSMWINPEGYQRDFKYLLLGDLARADCDAFLLHNLMTDPDGYDYRWGLTYAGAFTILIPKSLWPDRPEIRVDAGSEAQWGKATELKSTRLYGLSGEALLNFGAWGVIPLFAIYGACVGWYRRKLTSWNSLDARFFLAPFVTSLLIRALVYDSDTLVFALVTEGTLVLLAVWGSSRRSDVLASVDHATSHRL